MDTIRIECTGSGELALNLITPLQGDLKTLSNENYLRLKTEILEDGYSFPIAVYECAEDGNIYILDGHQRYETLSRMRDEGFKIPQIPINMVEAKSLNHAKKKLLGAASQYGVFNQDGANNFIGSISGMSEDMFKSSFHMPSIDLNLIEFKPDDMLVVDVKAHERIIPMHGENEKRDGNTTLKKYIICPHCKEMFDKEDALLVSDVDHA